MNTLKRTNSPNESLQSESENKIDEYTDRKAKQRGKKHKLNNEYPLDPLLKDSISVREQKKIDQYARLFQQQDQVCLSQNLKVEKKKLKKIKINLKQMEGKETLETSQKDQVEDSKSFEKLIEEKYIDEPHIDDIDPDPLKELNGAIQTETLIQEFQNTNSNQNIVSPQWIEIQQDNKVPVEDENQITFKLQMNPKLKMQEKNHLFLYLSECQDQCSSTMQKLATAAPQLYSPPRSYLKPINDQSNLFAINSEVYHETQILTSTLTTRFKSYGDSVTNFGPEQREFINKYVDKKYLRNVLRESRMQIYKRGAEKGIQNIKGFSKLIPKKY